ncbi:MAG: DUF370 domain-containing protein [Candidatus Abyssobacteria bacterium SURF_5]|jgi:regulator of extracellular matrix RemA (YlzA/DUF370 family)|uniref:DUF370 domain-containing protein n=1 Tax=Abyssobacteria bacterium (strain SURF_5) TaxID=2093360 RepID=A0A3A4NFY6_ABYX5|nr:MAG: DUF370 domain-containing protein [Candidatus Abyssubacteria bacterium SURF_5]
MSAIINIGFGGAVMVEKVVAVILPDSKPSVRLRDAARNENRLIDATQGHKTRALIITTSNHVILCGINAETIIQRIKESSAT